MGVRQPRRNLLSARVLPAFPRVANARAGSESVHEKEQSGNKRIQSGPSGRKMVPQFTPGAPAWSRMSKGGGPCAAAPLPLRAIVPNRSNEESRRPGLIYYWHLDDTLLVSQA